MTKSRKRTLSIPKPDDFDPTAITFDLDMKSISGLTRALIAAVPETPIVIGDDEYRLVGKVNGGRQMRYERARKTRGTDA